MSYNVFIPLDKTVVDKLPFLGDAYQYLYHDSQNNTYRGILYEISDDNYTKASKKLLGANAGQIVMGDKVFIMSGCAIPQFKIKDYLRVKGATMTSDITVATKFIGNEMISEHVVRIGEQRSSALVFDAQYCRTVMRDISLAVLAGIEDPITETGTSQSVVLTDSRYDRIMITNDVAVTNYASGLISTDHDIKRFITPLGAMILYQSILRQVPIINDDHIFKDLDKTIILDRESYKSLDDMLNSEDLDNHRVAADLLAGCDIDKSLFYIYKLARAHAYDVSRYSQFKHVRLFLDKSQWNIIRSMKAELFISHMHAKGLMTKEYFNELIREAVSPYKLKLESEVFQMVMRPSEEYRQYAHPDHVFPVASTDLNPVDGVQVHEYNSTV